MFLIEQLIQLLSEPPGNIVYHLLTLFALQVVFAVSLGQWRRNRRDTAAKRTFIAAAVLFGLRLVMLFTAIVVGQDAFTAVAILPPLEQLAHTATNLFLVWAIVPPLSRLPRLGDVLLIVAAVGVGVVYAFFAQTWAGLAATSQPYSNTAHATVWAILQLTILSIGLGRLIVGRTWALALPLSILILRLAITLVHFWNAPEIIPTTTHIAYWLRFGDLIVLPLWAVHSYRQSVVSLLAQMGRPTSEELVDAFAISATLVHAPDMETAVAHAMRLMTSVTGATYVAIALHQPDHPNQLRLTSNLSPAAATLPRNWNINLDNWPAFRQAMEQHRAFALQPQGLGARQLFHWYQEMGINSLGTLYIQPMYTRDNQPVGLFLLAGVTEEEWPADQIAPIGALGTFLGQTFHTIHTAPATTSATSHPSSDTEGETAVSGTIIALENERDELAGKLQIAETKWQQAESRATTALKRAQALAETLEALDSHPADQRVQELEAEVEQLRESLIEAEEAMALAAASDSGLSTEWVMLAITRYSGQLEEAQIKIQALEKGLEQWAEGPMNQLIISLVQELRTPMTSIGGYTALLLSEQMGITDLRERDFLVRVQSNVERMNELLAQLLETISQREQTTTFDPEVVDVYSVAETAVRNVLGQVREKNLRLDLNVPPDLPLLPADFYELGQVISSLLHNACQASGSNGRVALTAQASAVPLASDNGHAETVHYLQLQVTDSGNGIAPADLGHVFDPHHDANAPLIAGLGDTGAALAVSRRMVERQGGRIWVESEMGVGSTFSVLLPLAE